MKGKVHIYHLNEILHGWCNIITICHSLELLVCMNNHLVDVQIKYEKLNDDGLHCRSPSLSVMSYQSNHLVRE